MLLNELESQAKTHHEKEYINDLLVSTKSLARNKKKTLLDAHPHNHVKLLMHSRAEWLHYVQQYTEALKNTVNREAYTVRSIVANNYSCPRVSPVFFLEQLASPRWSYLSLAWKQCLINYALALTELQRVQRLLKLVEIPEEFTEELAHHGHTNWQPMDFPKSLLMEVESGVLIRPVQEAIARKMRTPPDGENAVMLLAMGQGKSSVLTQIVAATLADGSRLVRVIVAKPQSKQILQMLVEKLGGMLNHRIYHLPFSRALKISQTDAHAIHRMLVECKDNGGLLLLQPEHMLSLQLMGLECMLTGASSVGNALLKCQHLFDTQSRDIVDESDENFSVRFELIYTCGNQSPIELSPERWYLIQHVLKLVSECSTVIKERLPLSIEVDDRWRGRFPKIRLLRSDATHMLLDMLAKHICTQGLPGFPVQRQPPNVRAAIFEYITASEPTKEVLRSVENDQDCGFFSTATRSPLFLVRGLIACGILSFVFGNKRWRVNYGLDENRLPSTRLAVPYRGKDQPTSRSEFSHPDVVISLTSLSYYYGGITDEDLLASFQHLLRSDQADVEYSHWTNSAPNLPAAFRQLIGINFKDKENLSIVLPALRYSRGVIDYYLSHLVFPKEMKEFPHKLSSSGWDIAKIKTHPTTGFSGTNDSRHVLPLSITQLDLEETRFTNAQVLDNILDDRNTVEFLPCRNDFLGTDAELLLGFVTKMAPPVRIIIDVGAQILELDNRQVAVQWLSSMEPDSGIEAAIYFNDLDEICVVDWTGRTELLQISPYLKQLDRCLLFLDETHCRGSDFKLGPDARAAVTLGANLTKDRLVQACMRMRKLGKGQSVAFCVSQEIATKIQARKQGDSRLIDVKDVLSWAIGESCTDLRRSMPLWAIQGQRYEKQKDIWDKARSETGYDLSKARAKQYLEKEARSLEDRYRPFIDRQGLALHIFDTTNENIRCIVDRCKKFDSLAFNSSSLQEEQERELSPEIQAERQIERPRAVKAERHHLHADVEALATTGILRIGFKGDGFVPAFQSLCKSTAAKDLHLSQFPEELLVTREFARTVQLEGSSDFYERPVQWILISKKSHAYATMVIISPYEARCLLPVIKKHCKVTLCIYLPRSNVQAKPLDSLDLYTEGAPFDPAQVPRKLVILLNLFAGQLYFKSYKDYIETCDLLGLSWKPAKEGQHVQTDGFIVPKPGSYGFQTSPVKFLRGLMTKVRRNCESIEKTAMGRMLDGTLLEKNEFDEGTT